MLPSDRHSPVLNVLRLAKGFLASTGQTLEARYGAYVQVFSAAAAERLMRITGYERYDAIASAFGMAHSDDALNRMMVVDAETQLPDDLLLLTDKMSMATSLECRVPLLDHELVELAARMPESVKIRGGRLKHAMKLALADVLPPAILARKKRGFGTPMGAWLKHDLSPLMHRLLSRTVVEARGLFEYPAVRELIALHEASRIDGTDQLVALINLEIWSRMYLDKRTPDDVTIELKEQMIA
jgi:asparagine synthase (glutamine-hydrolysing)